MPAGVGARSLLKVREVVITVWEVLILFTVRLSAVQAVMRRGGVVRAASAVASVAGRAAAAVVSVAGKAAAAVASVAGKAAAVKVAGAAAAAASVAVKEAEAVEAAASEQGGAELVVLEEGVAGGQIS